MEENKIENVKENAKETVNEKVNASTNVNNMTIEIDRMPAKKIRICDIVNGKYFFPNAEQKKAAYVITPFGQTVSRINVVATVVDKFLNEDESYCSLAIDDGTGIIKVKAFKNEVKTLVKFELGDLVLAIGKLREYSGEMYVASEAVRKINDANFEQMRRLELLNELSVAKRMVDELGVMHEDASLEDLKQFAAKKFGLEEEQLQVVIENLNEKKTIDYKPMMMEVISKLDTGKGVEMHKLFEQNNLNLPNFPNLQNLPEDVIESTINDLLSEGFLFEPSPGILKKI